MTARLQMVLLWSIWAVEENGASNSESFADATLGTRSELPQSKDRNWNWQQTWNGVRGFVPETHTYIHTHTQSMWVTGSSNLQGGSVQTMVSHMICSLQSLRNRLRIKHLICSCHSVSFEDFPHMKLNRFLLTWVFLKVNAVWTQVEVTQSVWWSRLSKQCVRREREIPILPFPSLRKEQRIASRSHSCRLFTSTE